MRPLPFVLLLACGEPSHTATVPVFTDAGGVPLTPTPHDIGCTIQYDREEMGHMAALDECLGSSREACWSRCESTCNSCGVACARDPACEAHCLSERDTCKANHCKDVHAQCRQDLVRSWLANKCDAVCEPDAGVASAACNPARCDALLNAPERKTLDPRWQRNNCDDACARVWKCAEKQCNKTPGCAEPIKMLAGCLARVTGAAACGLAQSPALCPEP